MSLQSTGSEDILNDASALQQSAGGAKQQQKQHAKNDR